MSLTAFNRMRLRRVEEMRPENVAPGEYNKPEPIIDDAPNAKEKKLDVVEEPKEEVKVEVKRGSSRKK